MATFTVLRCLHERLEELFLLHQEALLECDLPLARSRFDDYEAALAAHLRLEEERLLPVYRRAGRIPGGPEEFFTGEHRKLRALLERCRLLLDEALRDPVPDRRAIIRLFDLEATFKSLTEHHHQREENILFPALDRVTTAVERSELLAQCLEGGWQ